MTRSFLPISSLLLPFPLLPLLTGGRSANDSMITPHLLYLALLAVPIAGAFDFDWTSCNKESACFICPSEGVLAQTTSKPTTTTACNVILSIRAFDATMKTLLVRLLLHGTEIDYEKGASLSLGGLNKVDCVSKAGKVTVATEMDYDLLSPSSSSSAHLYCEFVVRHSAEILLLPVGTSQFAVVTYTESAGPKTVQMAYQGFRDAVKAAMTCDPALIKFDRNLKGVNETTQKVSSLHHSNSCGKDTRWQLVYETSRDSGFTEVVAELRCEQDSTHQWGWKVKKSDGSMKSKVGEFRAHCVTNTCLMCSEPAPCSSPGCVNPTFRSGERKNGAVHCGELSCPPDHLLSTASKNSTHATCTEVMPHRYQWTLEGTAVETVQCVKPNQQPPPADTNQQLDCIYKPADCSKTNKLIIGACAGVLGLVLIVIVIYCIVRHRKRKAGSGSDKKSLSTLTVEGPLYTGRLPDSDPNLNLDTGNKPAAKTAEIGSKNEVKGEMRKESDKEKTGTGNWMKQLISASTPRLKKKSTVSSKKAKTTKQSPKSKTDVDGQSDESKISRKDANENETERYNPSREQVPEGPIKNYAPDHTPYESLANFQGVGETPPKASPKPAHKSPKVEAPKTPKTKAKNKTQTNTELSAIDKSKETTGLSIDDRPNSLEPMRDRPSKESQKDDRTQSRSESKK